MATTVLRRRPLSSTTLFSFAPRRLGCLATPSFFPSTTCPPAPSFFSRVGLAPFSTSFAAPKAISSFEEIDTKTGEFKREETALRSWVSTDGSTEFPVESGRYHLIISLACPWAHRCLMYIHLKGLQDAITVSVVNPVWVKTKPDDPEDSHWGWGFDASFPNATDEPLFGAKTLREVYTRLDTGVGRPTTPLLVDKKAMKAVNNESADITAMFNSAFDSVAKNPGVDLMPAGLKDDIDKMNDFIYNSVNNGVYRSGFATTQDAYDTAVTELFDRLDALNDILSSKRYLHGDNLTDSDIRLFATLVRFDEVYTVHFKCNKRMIREYPALKGYVQDVFQHPAIGPTVDMAHIRNHYYRSHPKVNPYAIVPVGHGWEWFSEPHSRADLVSTK